MCTVTFIPGEAGVYHLTSNRDEHTGRARALPPRYDDGLLYPRDGEAGGSWIAVKRGDAGVLLNGAFATHRRRENYRRSRGLVFLDVLRAESPLEQFDSMPLWGIEPFTLVLFLQGRLFECRWDGERKHVRELETERPHVWSSVTLYDEPTRRQREQQLARWWRRENISTGKIVDFHRAVRRQGEIATVSITNVRIAEGRGRLAYYDLGGNRAGRINRLLIRLRHWEYWPFAIVYAPIFLYWLWLSLKARSLFFFSTSNPGITNSGFLLESKMQIYEGMPAGSYPMTLYCEKGSRMGDLGRRMAEKGLVYPMMAKPDIGQRGMGVELLTDECQLLRYVARSKVPFLLQEYIDYPMEAGIFYHRVPGQATGRITGIVGKELLAVTGDGHSTVEKLLARNDRYVLQLPALRRSLGGVLRSVPASGERLCLAPYGNHSRGAKFVDCGHRITPQLSAIVDDLCQRIPGFYFGRLDIRFRDWERLAAGEAFSVIELNGAGSEPTHIYDPKHSLFFAWREIRRHLDILYTVSRANVRLEGLVPMRFWQGVRMLRDYSRYEKLIQ